MKHITSLLFLLNAAHAFIRGVPVYATAFLVLAITSVILHTSNKTADIFYIDQAAIFLVFLVGLYYVFRIRREFQLLAVLSILTVIIMYYGGYLTDSLCFDASYDTATLNHCGLHIIGSLGHHCIMAGL